MAQLTIYLDDQTIKQIEHSAHIASTSVSKWVKTRLLRDLNSAWPEGYFKLFGSIKDDSFKRPTELSLSKDSKRAAF